MLYCADRSAPSLPGFVHNPGSPWTSPRPRQRRTQASSYLHRGPSFNFRVSPDFSLGKLLVLVTYGLIVLYGCLYRSDPFPDYDRTGNIVVSQVPVVMALAGKSNWLSWLSGVGYEKVNINQSRTSLF